MKIQPRLEVIVEGPVSYAASSQDARVEGSFHRSEMVQNHIHAQRLQAQMAAAEIKKIPVSQQLRNVSYKAALVTGAMAFPTIACAFFVKNGWAIPAGLAATCLLCFLLAGKRTPEIEQASAEMRERAKEPLPM